MRKPLRKFKILAFSLLGILAIWLMCVGVMIWNFGEKDYAEKSDCIIVLGAAVRGDEPSPVFRERIRHAITLYKRGEAPVIVFTGGYGDGEKYAESEVGKKVALSEGVNEESILIERVSRTTRQNLIEAREVMEKAELESAIIVSDPLHLKRASMMAEGLEMKAVTSPTPTTRYRSLKTRLEFLLREVYFYHHYLIFGA